MQRKTTVFNSRAISDGLRMFSLVGIVGLVLAMVAMFDSGPVYGTTVPPTPTGESGTGTSGGEVAPELPAPDLPSGNEQGYSFDLRYSLGADLEGLPREASVYQLKRDTPTLESVQKIAD
ncbi:MAG TPA: hypothetical protein PK819_14900, partial [Thermomicrobiales bacterium]|nr:hypothetical protein [Thermomicrobiales bacterium]